ncbi:MAG: Bax inhibitor-1/YccA family protein [Clostridiaceae bacterium]|nr:Bax inhibitor-1/YccA family protein [Clostridiaceae bacterium]
MVRVYGWMFIGLLVTAMSALFVASTPSLIELIFLNNFTFYGLMIAEIAFVWFLSSRAMKMDYTMAAAAFLFYAALNGLTMSVIFLYFSGSSIAMAFFFTAGFFGFMSGYGLITKTDLTSFGKMMLMGLIGLILVSVVNIFLRNGVFEWIISFAGVIIFLGLTAYDSQKIKYIHQHYSGTEKERNVAIVGALTLYLDFINLFLYILRILGRKRS